MYYHNMAKAKKTETTTQEATVPATVVTDTTVSKSTKSRSTKKMATTTVEAKVEDVKNTTTVTETTESTENIFTETFTEFMAKLQAIATQINSLKSEFRYLGDCLCGYIH